MPVKLKVATDPVKWRIRSDDLELLRALHASSPDGVNGFVRDLLHAWCERKREVLGGTHSRDAVS